MYSYILAQCVKLIDDLKPKDMKPLSFVHEFVRYMYPV